MDNVHYLLKVSDIHKPFDIDVIDDCEETPEDKPFPITFKIDYDTEHIYIISIDESLLNNNNGH